jgi:hypothetical protein
MGTRTNFENELLPRPVVQIGRKGDEGIVEIQDMMFTVRGATAGAIVAEWNIFESSKGSAGIWGKIKFKPSVFEFSNHLS